MWKKPSSIDNLVLGTVNAPWKRAIDADLLAQKVATSDPTGWLPHVATFFGEVSPVLVVEFARIHGIAPAILARSYRQVKVLTGERNRSLEAEFSKRAQAA